MRDADFIIGFDTEFVRAKELDDTADDGTNAVLSYQTSVFVPETSARFSSIAFTAGMSKRNRISFERFISAAINKALEQGSVGPNTMQNIDAGKVTVYAAAHYSRADLPSFRDFNRLKRRFDGIRKTFVTSNNPYAFTTSVKLAGTWKYITVSLRLYDTMLLAPAGAGSLAALGDLLNFPKLSIPPVTTPEGATVPAITRMDLALKQHRKEFIAYATRDSEIAVDWLRSVMALSDSWDLEKQSSTIGAMAVQLFLKTADDDKIDLNPLLGITHDENGEEIVSPDYLAHQGSLASHYHGARNETYGVGVYKGAYTDFDIKGAYTTSMAALRGFDWANTLVTKDITILARFDVATFALVQFSFPADTRMPCLPVAAGDNGLLFPLKGRSYCTGPELAVALSMGAKLKVINGLYIPWIAEDAPRPFVSFTRIINVYRKKFTELHGKGSALELLVKEAGNSVYGKASQGVAGMRPVGIAGLSVKRAFNPRNGQTDEIPPSAITNPAAAALITGLLRAVLSEILAALPRTVTILSATTDGWLSDATLEQALAATQGPACRYFASLRTLVSTDGSGEIIELKHKSQHVLSFKTRGSLALDGGDGTKPIIARAGHRLPGKYDSVVDEIAAFETLYRTRQHDTKLTSRNMISLRTQWLYNADLHPEERKANVSLCYDLKRQPVDVHDHDGLIRFATRPWDDIRAFRAARDRLDTLRTKKRFVLRTAADWGVYEGAGGLAVQDSGTTRTQLQNGVLEALARGTDGFPRRRPIGRGKGCGTTHRQIADLMAGAGVKGVTRDVVRNAAGKPAKARQPIDPVTLSPEDHRLLAALAAAFPAAHATITQNWLARPLPESRPASHHVLGDGAPQDLGSGRQQESLPAPPATPASQPEPCDGRQKESSPPTPASQPKTSIKGYRKWLLTGTASAICETLKTST